MTWKKSDSLIARQLNHHGLADAVAASAVCREAERLYPGLFKAISLKNGILHLETDYAQQLEIKLIEGKLLDDLNRFADIKNLPPTSRIRLTFSEDAL
jgi:hypothetical protein